eukprot:m.514762 g.514762  ORF g.514762 m.514762 type:complete len:731 (-) comp21914_c0_seq3:70-2262(-)
MSKNNEMSGSSELRSEIVAHTALTSNLRQSLSTESASTGPDTAITVDSDDDDGIGFHSQNNSTESAGNADGTDHFSPDHSPNVNIIGALSTSNVASSSTTSETTETRSVTGSNDTSPQLSDIISASATASSLSPQPVVTTNAANTHPGAHDNSNVAHSIDPVFERLSQRALPANLEENRVEVFSPVSIETSLSDDFKSPPESRKRRSSSVNTADDDDEESYTCPICFDGWSTSGIHRVVSLKCGHLFGKQCIEKWLKGRGEKCPQCNAAAKKVDIRPIFTRVVRAVDTAGTESALRDLQNEKSERERAQRAEAKARIELQIIRKQYEKLKEQLRTANSAAATEPDLSRFANSGGFAREDNDSGSTGASDATAHAAVDRRYVLQKVVQIPQNGCRVLAYDRRHAMMLVSAENDRPTPFSPAGAGLVKVSTLSLGRTEYVGLHRKPIRDVRMCPDGSGVVLTVSLDKTAKLTSIHSNTVACTYTLDVPSWTCCWNHDNPVLFYCGLTNNSICEFDTRNTSTFVRKFNASPQATGPKPLVALHHLSAATDGFQLQGLLATTLGGTTFLPEDPAVSAAADADAQIRHDVAPLAGSSTWCVPHRPSHSVLTSLRPSRTTPWVRHIVSALTPDATTGVACGVQGVLRGPLRQTALTRSHLLARPDAPDVLSVAAGDEQEMVVKLWDVDSGEISQRLSCMGQRCTDICTFSTNNRATNPDEIMAVLTDSRVLVHSWS